MINRRDFLKSSAFLSATAMLAAHGVNIGQAQDKQTYYMVTFVSGIEYWIDCYSGMLDAAQFLGVEALYTGTPEYESEAAVRVLKDTMALKPDGILLTVMDETALTPAINEAIESGIPLVTFDADAPRSKRFSFVGTDNYAAGVIAARYLGSQIQAGRVAITTGIGQNNLDLRVAGFRDTLAAEFPDLVSDESLIVDDELSSATAARNLTALFEANPDIKGIFSTNALGATGVVYALRQTGMSESVHKVVFDYDDITLNLIDEGDLSAALAQGTWQMGFWSMMFAYMVRNGHIKSVSDWQAAGISPLPPRVDTGVVVITSENSHFWRKSE